MARADSKVFVSGTVPDIRPYFWDSTVSIVPSRIFGGTRLKIFEAMAAKIPVVSTSIGAEGLSVEHGRNIYLADTPEEFAQRCLELLDVPERREQMAQAAFELVKAKFSWEHAARVFEATLEQEAPKPRL
jgi:glycosyltransferase involved in cell wall biosynthesis